MLQPLSRPSPVGPAYSSSPSYRLVYHGGALLPKSKRAGYSSSVQIPPSVFSTAGQHERDDDVLEKDDLGKCHPRRVLTDPGRKNHQVGQKSDHRVISGVRGVHGQLITGMARQMGTQKARRDEMVAGSTKLPLTKAFAVVPANMHSSTSTQPSPTASTLTFSKGKTVVKCLKGLSKPLEPINMANYDNRLNSFHCPPKWELSLIDVVPNILSSHGFWYTGQEDIVHCYACSVELCDWESSMDVFSRHFNASPNCPHLRQYHERCIVELCQRQFISYRNVEARLESFHFACWPLKGIVSPEELASAGFFYLGKGGKVQCFSCGCVNEKWEVGVSALTVHKKIYAKCPFLLETVSSVSPLPPSPCQSAKPVLSPDYQSAEARLQSFKHYPSDSAIDKDDFAEAGFYLVQLPCTVRCFACDLKESSWSRGDNPHKRHAQKSRNCPFLKASPSPAPLETLHPSKLPEPAFSREELSKWFRVPSASEPPQAGAENHHSYLYPSSLPESPPENPNPGPASMFEQVTVREESESGSIRRRASVHGFPQPIETESSPRSRVSNGETHPETPEHEEELSILNRPVYYPPSYHRRQKRDNPAGTNNKRTTNLPTQTITNTNITTTTTTTTVDSLGTMDAEDKVCIICFEHPKEYALLPCGHLCSCRYCVSKLDSFCPVCRKSVSGKARIYLT